MQRIHDTEQLVDRSGCAGLGWVLVGLEGHEEEGREGRGDQGDGGGRRVDGEREAGVAGTSRCEGTLSIGSSGSEGKPGPKEEKGGKEEEKEREDVSPPSRAVFSVSSSPHFFS